MPIDPNIHVETAHPNRGVSAPAPKLATAAVPVVDTDFLAQEENKAEAINE